MSHSLPLVKCWVCGVVDLPHAAGRLFQQYLVLGDKVMEALMQPINQFPKHSVLAIVEIKKVCKHVNNI